MLRDIPNPEICLTMPVLIDDIIQVRFDRFEQCSYYYLIFINIIAADEHSASSGAFSTVRHQNRS